MAADIRDVHCGATICVIAGGLASQEVFCGVQTFLWSAFDPVILTLAALEQEHKTCISYFSVPSCLTSSQSKLKWERLMGR